MSLTEQEIERFKEEEAKAADRIGRTSDDATRWLIRFAQLDLNSLSEGQWSDLSAEIHAFTKRGPPLRVGRAVAHIGAVFQWRIPRAEEVDPKTHRSLITIDSIRPSREQTIFLQKWAHFILDGLVTGASGSIAIGALHLDILPQEPSFKTSPLRIRTHTAKDAFGFHFAHLLADHYERLRRCGECQTLFLADRRNQRFCTTRCLTRVTQRRWRERQVKATKKRGKGPKQRKQESATKEGGRHGKARR